MMKTRNPLSIAVLALASAISYAAPLGTVQVYKDPMCGCCGKYVEYLRAEGIKVEVISVADMAAIKAVLDRIDGALAETYAASCRKSAGSTNPSRSLLSPISHAP